MVGIVGLDIVGEDEEQMYGGRDHRLRSQGPCVTWRDYEHNTEVLNELLTVKGCRSRF